MYPWDASMLLDCLSNSWIDNNRHKLSKYSMLTYHYNFSNSLSLTSFGDAVKNLDRNNIGA